MRVITDELHAALIKILAQDSKVQIFQQLLLAPRTEEQEANKEEEK